MDRAILVKYLLCNIEHPSYLVNLCTPIAGRKWSDFAEESLDRVILKIHFYQ